MHLNTYNVSVKRKGISFKACPMPVPIAQSIDKRLMKARSIDLFCHTSPDEDTFNSAKVMYKYLSAMGKKVRIIISGNLKGLYEYNDKSLKILNPVTINPITIGRADMAFVLDLNAVNRVSKESSQILKKYNCGEILGFDHHIPAKAEEPVTKKYIHISNTQDAEQLANKTKNSKALMYIDSTAKSCNSILFRFFEALKKQIPADTLKSLYCGMSDDMMKSGFLEFGEDKGLKTLKQSEKLAQDKYNNAREVYSLVNEKIPFNVKADIANHLDTLGKLNPAERDFQKKLFSEKIKFSNNGKLAYVAISPSDEEWQRLGQDNSVTSAILSDFRVKAITNSKAFAPELREKLSKIEAVAVFYRGPVEPDPSKELYRVSIHSKNGTAQKLLEHIRANLYEELKAGGHADRIGGRINTTDDSVCGKWVNYFLQAADKID